MSETLPRSDIAPRAAIAAMVWDALSQRRMQGGEKARFGAIVENIIAAMQGAVEPSEWAHAGYETAESIERRCMDGSAAAEVLLRLRPEIGHMGFDADWLGTDTVGRGAGWSKTANAVELAKACNDVMSENDLMGGYVFRALKDIAVAAIQALPTTERRDAGRAVGTLIMRRMRVN